MKKLIATLIIIALLCLCSLSQAAGLTLWTLSGQVTGVDERNEIEGRAGWMFGSDNGGLEIYIGSTWYNQEARPQVMSIGIIEHLPDLIDPNNQIPFISGVLLGFISEDVVAQPYIGINGTFQFVDEDSGFFGVISGIRMKLTPNSVTEVIVEGRYINGVSELSGIPKAQIGIGLRIPFPTDML